jgi:recombination protein RecT
MSEIAKKMSIGNYLNFPATKKFLEENLNERRAEFVSNLISLCDNDSNLSACDPQKLMMCAMNATALNLPLNKNLGFAYIIPYNNVPSFQIGYKGLIQLAIRSGYYQFLNACEIREGEIERNKITGEIKFIGDQPDAKIIGYLAYLKLNTGFTASIYMSEKQIEDHALRFSKMYQYDKKNNKNSSKWSDALARPKMALKTVIKSLLGTYGILTTDLKAAFEKDTENEMEPTGPRGYEDAEIIPQTEPGKSEPEKTTL